MSVVFPSNVRYCVAIAKQHGHAPVSQGMGMFRCTACDLRGFLDNPNDMRPEWRVKCAPVVG